LYTSLRGGEEMRIEIRSDSVLISGYVNAVGRESRVLPSPKGRFKEIIVPKTFQKALMKGNEVELRFNHERKIGSTKEGTLSLKEDNIGLMAVATVTDQAVMEHARRNELRGWSFGFVAIGQDWRDHEDGIQRRSIDDMDLLEVSVLTKQPAYIATSIESRGEEEVLHEKRIEEFEAEITDNSQAKVDPKKQSEEKRESIDYSLLDSEITFLKLKGALPNEN
jgi:HK97 family phage prohead protease